MRRFIIGLLIGIALGWMVAWWRLGRAGQVGLTEEGREPLRIALPDLPQWEEEEVPMPEPVTAKFAEGAQEVAGDVLASARAAIAESEPLLAYCARCRVKRPIQNPEPTVTSDGRPAVRGTCPECGANMFRFVSF